jgi:hypothetical protein
MLHEATRRRIRELLDGKQCERCRQPARRLWRARYFCEDCFPGTRAQPVRVHHVWVAQRK